MADSPFGNFGIGNFSPLASMVQGGPSEYMQKFSPLYMLMQGGNFGNVARYLSPAYAMAKGGPAGYFSHFSPIGMAMGGGIGGSGGAGGIPLGLLNLTGR